MNRDKRNRGAAMVIVLCVLAVFLALSATVLLSGSVALNTARTNIIFERAKAQAVSLSNALVNEMTTRPSKQGDSYLAQYVRDEIMKNTGESMSAWPPFDEEKEENPGAVRMFSMDDESRDEQHQIRIEMYWTGDGLPDEKDADEYGIVETKNIHLYIDVVSTLNQSEFRVKNDFELLSIRKDSDGYDAEKASEKGNYEYEWEWHAVGREN